MLQRLVTYNLDQLHVHPDAELAILLVDESAMEQLHVQWMDEPGPTDVLSFPMDELRPGTEDQPTPAGLLGDLVLCPQVAIAQAEAAGHSPIEEMQLLTTHGLLHLLGFDHAEPEEEKEMFALQRDLLDRLRDERAKALGRDPMIAIFVLAAVVLVIFGGLLAASDSALTVLSRTDLVDLAAHSRSRRSLLAIAGDMGAHVNALNFMRVVSETTAAVLVSLAFAYSFKDWWWALLASALIMTAVSFVLVGSSPRSVGRAHSARRHAVLGSDHPHDPGHPRADRQRARRDRQPRHARAAPRMRPSRARSSCSAWSMRRPSSRCSTRTTRSSSTRSSSSTTPSCARSWCRAPTWSRSTRTTRLDTAMGLFLSRGVSRMPVLGEDVDEVVGILYLRDVARLEFEQSKGRAKETAGEPRPQGALRAGVEEGG